MRDLLASTLELFAYLLAAAVFTAAGLIAELISLSHFADGNMIFAAWLAAMGAVALYAGVVALGAQEVLPRVRTTFGK